MVIAFQFVRFDADMGIYALYIGQGGCTVIRDKNGSSYIYDCGSFDEKKIGEYKVIPFLKSKKISKINVFFVSHMDSDHLSGLLEMLESDNGDRCKGCVSGIAVEKIVIPKGKIQRCI